LPILLSLSQNLLSFHKLSFLKGEPGLIFSSSFLLKLFVCAVFNVLIAFQKSILNPILNSIERHRHKNHYNEEFKLWLSLESRQKKVAEFYDWLVIHDFKEKNYDLA
jgi:hypothetical protein